MVDVRGDVLRPPHCTTPAAVKSNKNQKWDQSSEQGIMNLILQRLDNMDKKKLGQLDTIQSSIANITVKMRDIESEVHT